MTGFWTGLGS